MEKAFKVVYGVKLYERKCTQCTNTFCVPDSSPQFTCSQFCEERAKRVKGGFYARLRQEKLGRKKKKYQIEESDYED